MGILHAWLKAVSLNHSQGVLFLTCPETFLQSLVSDVLVNIPGLIFQGLWSIENLMQYQRADGSPYFGMKLTEEHLEARLLADILEDLPIPSGETPDPGALFSSRAEAMASMNGAARSVLMNTPKRRQRPRLLNADKAEALFPDLVLERPGITSHFRVHFTARQCLERCVRPQR